MNHSTKHPQYWRKWNMFQKPPTSGPWLTKVSSWPWVATSGRDCNPGRFSKFIVQLFHHRCSRSRHGQQANGTNGTMVPPENHVFEYHWGHSWVREMDQGYPWKRKDIAKWCQVNLVTPTNASAVQCDCWFPWHAVTTSDNSRFGGICLCVSGEMTEHFLV